MPEKFVAPIQDREAFTCPNCGVYAHQNWTAVFAHFGKGFAQINGWQFGLCTHCKDWTVWRADNMIHPGTGTAPLPHPDLPDGIKGDYEEARDIAARSPRGAGALLRLVIQKLLPDLGGDGKNVNDDIASLVAKGIPASVQKSLDAVRVVGNDCVHPGTIDVRDDPKTVGVLFHLVNFITEKMISDPKQIEAIYGSLPAEKRAQIETRDKKKLHE